MSEVPKKSSKTGGRFTGISDLQNNVARVLFQAGNRQLSQKFAEKVYCPQEELGMNVPYKLIEFQRNSAFHAIEEFFTEKQKYPCRLTQEYFRYLGTINLL